MAHVVVTECRSRRVSLDLDSPELAASYDKASIRQLNHGKLLISALRVRADERVLDIGCGMGRLGAYVADVVGPLGEVLGVDPRPWRVDLAGRQHPRFTTCVGRAEDLSAFTSASFDVVYANGVFQRLEDRDKPAALAEAWRVLKAGGRIGLNGADADRCHQGAQLVREAVREEGLSNDQQDAASDRQRRVDAQQLRSLLRAAGFVEVEVTTRTFVDEISGADDLFALSNRSSSARPLASSLFDLSRQERIRVRDRLAHKLDALRSADGAIRLERYLVFATARKP
ncbi:MAG: methyltransferase domain-containing protein [Polyangiales bacterium]